MGGSSAGRPFLVRPTRLDRHHSRRDRWQEERPMAQPEWKLVERHLNRVFHSRDILLKKRQNVEDSQEVYMGPEFLGTVYIDEDEGETSYIFEMAILDIDLAD
jgi:hypothetical protein